MGSTYVSASCPGMSSCFCVEAMMTIIGASDNAIEALHVSWHDVTRRNVNPVPPRT